MFLGDVHLIKKLTALLLILSTILCLCSCTDTPIYKLDVELNGALNVHFIDVGQGDCTLLESDGKFVLIDAGEVEYADTVCGYLKENNVSTIEYVIATHPHSDHCGGLTKVLNTFECKNFITTETTQRTEIWKSVLKAVDNNDVKYIDAKTSSTYSFGQSQFEILGPVSSDYGDNYNNYSVVLKASCGDTSFLFTGDAEKLSENDILQTGCDLSCDVLKVGHHGSSTSSGGPFLNAANPTCAVISCGKQNDYGHPHKETMSALKARNITTFRTDELSTIIASSDKKEIRFYYKTTDKVTQQTINPALKTDMTYIGNKNSKKFHISTCDGIKNMKETNKVKFSNRDDAVQSGYSPCNTCQP